MKNTKWLFLALVAVFAAACDPYDDAKTGTPSVVTVMASNTIDGYDAVIGTEAAGAWTVASVPCGDALDAGHFDHAYFVIVLDRQVDGGLIQTDPFDCTPAPTSLTITPAPATGFAWYTCYSAASSTPTWGGSIVAYQAAVGGSAGWEDFEYLPAATYNITGTIAGRAINVSVTPDATTCTP